LITRKYQFRDSLSISRLAEQFDASRQPISAALNHLRSLGYLDIIPQVGCHAVSPSSSEIDDFFYMLGKVESRSLD
jgi:DNA-binding GntR family transcriptional regulator